MSNAIFISKIATEVEPKRLLILIELTGALIALHYKRQFSNE